MAIGSTTERRSMRMILMGIVVLAGMGFGSGCISNGDNILNRITGRDPDDKSPSLREGFLGRLADIDPSAKRLEVRPKTAENPVGTEQVIIATIYDGDGKPRRGRRIEWELDGPGSIVDVDDRGYLPERRGNRDVKEATSRTESHESPVRRGRGKEEFYVGPGQAWIVVTSAVEGKTTVTAHASAITDRDRNTARVRLQWVNAALQLPPESKAKAGEEYVLPVRTQLAGNNRSGGERVRFRVASGPPIALTGTSGFAAESLTEAVSAIGNDGMAKVRIAQPTATTGESRIDVELIRPDPRKPGAYEVVARREASVLWTAAELSSAVNAPTATALDRDLVVTYSATAAGSYAVKPGTISAPIPDGLRLVRTEPKAAVDGNLLVWTMPTIEPGKQHTVQAVFRPIRTGNVSLTADVVSREGLRSQATAAVQVTEVKLAVELKGPASGIVGEALPFQVIITNTGDGSADQVRVKAIYDEQLTHAEQVKQVDRIIDTIAPGKSATIELPLSATRGGRFTVKAGASAEGGLIAPPRSVAVDIEESKLSVQTYGPSQVYVGQEVTWNLLVRNAGDMSLGNVRLTADLPREFTFKGASDAGRFTAGRVTWDLGDAPPQQERTLSITGIAEKIAEKSELSAMAVSDSIRTKDGTTRTVSLVKSAGLQAKSATAVRILGMASLQISVTDSADPVGVGSRLTYTVRVKNTGSAPAAKVVTAVEVPIQLRAVKGTGKAGPAIMDGRRLSFPEIASLAAGAEETFTIETEVMAPGDARFRVEAQTAPFTQPIRAEEPTRILGLEARPRGK